MAVEAAEQLAGAEAVLAATAVAAGAARRTATRVASYLLLNGVADHPASGVGLAVRDADLDRAGGLVRDAMAHVDRVGLGVAFRHALLDGDLAGDLLRHHPVDCDLGHDRNLLATAFHHGAGFFNAGLAGNPMLDGLGVDRFARGFARRAARIAAAIAGAATAVRTLRQLVDAIHDGRAGADFLALPMAVVDRFLDHLGHGDAGDLGLHAGPFFNGTDAFADGLGHVLHFADGLVRRHIAGPGFRSAFMTVRGVGLLTALGRVDRARRLVVFGDPFLHADGSGRGGASRRTSRCTALSGADGKSRRSNESTSHKGFTKLLHNHAFSYVAVLTDPCRYGTHFRWAGPGEPDI